MKKESPRRQRTLLKHYYCHYYYYHHHHHHHRCRCYRCCYRLHDLNINIIVGGCQCPVDLAVQLAQLCSAILIVRYSCLSKIKCMYVCMYVCMRVCIYVCMYVCIQSLNIQMFSDLVWFSLFYFILLLPSMSSYFLQRVSIACYAKRCISHRKSV